MENFSNAKYSSVAQTFHWITAILVVVAFIYGPGGPENRVYLASRDFERSFHETLGIAVFAISILRILWKFIDTKPQPILMKRWMHIASKAVQGILYLLLFAVPLTAIFGAWMEGHAIVLLTGHSFSPAVMPSHDLGAQISNLHGWLGDVVLWLAGAHAAAAIYHHFVLKDTVLNSMLPTWVSRNHSSKL